MDLQSSNDIPKPETSPNKTQSVNLEGSEKQFQLFETIINAITPSSKKFTEKTPGVYAHDTIQDNTSDENLESEDSKRNQRSKRHETSKTKDYNDISNPTDLFKTILIQTPENLGLVPFQMIFNYIQLQLPQQINEPKAQTHQTTLFTTELAGNERLDISVQKQNNALRVTLFADADLQQFLLDKLVALKEHLKKKKIDVDNLDLEIRPIEELSKTDKDRVPLEKHKVKFIGPNHDNASGDLLL